jgi:hypothetical protein
MYVKALMLSRFRFEVCVSLIKMSPLTAVLKLPIMRRDIIGMSQREGQRYHLRKMVLERKTTLQDASRVMEDSHRHAKRLKRKLVFNRPKCRQSCLVFQ